MDHPVFSWCVSFRVITLAKDHIQIQIYREVKLLGHIIQ